MFDAEIAKYETHVIEPTILRIGLRPYYLAVTTFEANEAVWKQQMTYVYFLHSCRLSERKKM